MTLFTYLMLAALMAGGFYLVTSSRYSEIILGLCLLADGVNSLFFVSSQSAEGGLDPLSQSLILATTVICFSLIAFFSAFVLDRLKNKQTDEVSECDEEAVL